MLGGFLRRLRTDRAGNTLAIVAASIFLMMALIGGGTDMARAYMTRTSLQNACDAGVLAGRKAMSKSGSYGDAERAKANKMFNFNFRPSVTDSTTPTFTTNSTDGGEVTGTASTTMPTVLMGLFGYRSLDLDVDCSAELQLASADVMFVLDTTGSMADCPDNSTCNSNSSSKIQGLRDAVKDFYKTVAGAVVDKDKTRVRFAFVPYAMSVNASTLVTSGAMPTSYFANSNTYQTKLAYFNTPQYNANTPTTAPATTETYSSNITQTNCNNYGVNAYPTNGGNPVSGGGPAPTATTSTKYAYSSWTKVSGSGTSALGTCKRTKTVTTTTYTTVYKFTNWRYIKSSIDTSGFSGFGSVSLASSVSSSATVPTAGYYNLRQLANLTGTTGITTSSYTWNGCLEERATVQDATMDPVPSGATDLDIDSAPSSDATRWKIHLPMLAFTRGNYFTSLDTTTNYSAQSTYCPSGQMKQFTTVDTTAPDTVPTWLNTYLNSLVANGGTYHDIGMIWGARLGSPSGIFASNVNDGDLPSVSRHIIFMTDGLMAPNNNIYTTYGLEMYDNRVAPQGTTDTQLATYHNARFLAACQKAKELGYTVWVIGFGQTLTDSMKTCATANRAYYSSNTTDLKNTFKYIAGQVADLRINH